MPSVYNHWLVALSIVVAVLVSYTALRLAARVATSEPQGARVWLGIGAVAMGIGIWSMHFIGMLAFSLPIPLAYNIPTTLASLAVAIITSGFALGITSGQRLNVARLAGAAGVMGAGISAMHYMGMAAITIIPGISYDPLLVTMSILIAVVTSFVALWLFFRLREGNSPSQWLTRIAASIVMGLAISGMHYTAMAASRFSPGSFCRGGATFQNSWLAGTIGLFALGLLVVTLVTALYDSHADGALPLRSTGRPNVNGPGARRSAQQRQAAVSLVIILILLACFTCLGQDRPAIAPVLLIVSSTGSAALVIVLFLLAARAQRLRRRADARIGSLFMDSHDLQALTGPHGRFERVNPAFTELLGYSEEELLGSHFVDFVHRDDQVATLAEVQKVLQGAPTRSFVNRWQCKDGSYKWLEWNAGSSFTKGLYLASGRDITDRKEAEARLAFGADQLRATNQQLQSANAKLEEARHEAELANRAKSEFLAAMSHEIRTPMNGVIGMLDVLNGSSLTGEQLEMIGLVRESADSLLTIINDILDFSKIEAGRLEIESLPLSVADVVEKACELLDRLAARKREALSVFADPAIPETLLGDAGRLRQILVNLTSNAIKFSGDLSRRGQISVRAVLVEQGPDRVMVEFQVTDNGIGMDEPTLGRLFKAFTQGDASTTRRYGGTGLGLAISKQLSTLMGGDIVVKTTPDQGSTFTVRLPFLRAPQEARTAEAGSEIQGLSCLVVGGQSGFADDLAAYLASDSATVERAPDLAAARDWATAQPAGSVVWVVDVGAEPARADALQAAARGPSDLALVVVTSERSGCRISKGEANGIIRLDGNALTRRTLARAVAIAAGRVSPDWEAPAENSSLITTSTLPRVHAVSGRELILVAEDNEINRKVIGKQLRLLGYMADFAVNGRDALRHWQSGEYALLLTDLHMPELDGYDLALAIRDAERGRSRIPIIALTANAQKGGLKRCRVVGMDDYLSKPTTLAALAAALEKWMPAASAPPAVSGSTPLHVDVSVLEELIGKDQQVIAEVLQQFRVDATRLALDIVGACAIGRPPDAAAAAHKLKSSSRSVGALKLGELCAAIEVAGTAGDLSALTGLLYGFETEMAAVDNCLRTWQPAEPPVKQRA